MDLKNLFGYEGKTVVVSGAYSGMGLAAARLLQELGANVYTICRRNGRHSKLDFPVTGELYADFGVKEDLDALADRALQQIDVKKYDTELRDAGVRPIIKIGIAFRGKTAVVKRK